MNQNASDQEDNLSETELFVLNRASCLGIRKKEFIKIINLFYRDTGRFYHTLEHIKSCLLLYDEIQEVIFENNHSQAAEEARIEIQQAIIFHDVIYNPRYQSGQNEILSAALAYSLLFNNKVAAYIKDTIEHKNSHPYELWSVGAFFLDIDMSILASEPDTYAKYRSNIRKEYSFVDDHTFYSETYKFCLNWLNKRIYHTDYFFDKFETKAKENLNKTLIEAKSYLGI